MSERRVAHVVSQTGGRNNGASLLEQCVLQVGVSLRELSNDIVAQRHTHTGHLQRVREAVVYEDAAGQRKHLCLVLQSAEGSRENQAVVVAFELRPVVMSLGMPILLPEPLV